MKIFINLIAVVDVYSESFKQLIVSMACINVNTRGHNVVDSIMICNKDMMRMFLS